MKPLMLAVLVLTLGCIAMKAESTSKGLCDKKSPSPPCIDEPHEGDTQITGQVNKDVTVVTVKVDETDLGKAEIKPDGTFSITADSPLNQYNQVRATVGDNTTPVGPVPVTKSSTASGQSTFTLGMAGIDITSTSTSGPEQQYFAEFKLTAPVGLSKCLRPAEGAGTGPGKSSPDEVKKEGAGTGTAKSSANCDPLQSRLWAWFNPRIASVPTPNTAALSTLTSTSTALSGLGQLKLADITQTLELHGGLEVALIKPRDGVLFGNKDKATLGLSLVAGLGGVAPFNSATGAQEFDLISPASSASTGNVTGVLQQFTNNMALQTAPQYKLLYQVLSQNCAKTPTACSFEHVAFQPPDRSRFYRSWATGLRLKTFFFDSGCTSANKTKPDQCKAQDVFPGTMDVTLGQDETVTAGKLRHFVLTLSGNYPMPGFTWLRIFGSAYLGLEKNKNSPTLALVPTLAFVALNDPSVIVQPIQPIDQDYFRIGFGIDIVKAFSSLKGSSGNNTSSSNNTKKSGS